jgi:hypothetical protein
MGLQPFACWDCGFESLRRHGCLSLVSVVCRLCVWLITRPEESHRVLCVWVWQRSLGNEDTLAQQGLSRHSKKKTPYYVYMTVRTQKFKDSLCLQIKTYHIPKPEFRKKGGQLHTQHPHWHLITVSCYRELQCTVHHLTSAKQLRNWCTTHSTLPLFRSTTTLGCWHRS